MKPITKHKTNTAVTTDHRRNMTTMMNVQRDSVDGTDTPRDSIAISEESGVPLAPAKAGRLALLSSRAKIGLAIVTVVGLGMVGATIYAVNPACSDAQATLSACVEASAAEGDVISPHLISITQQDCRSPILKKTGFGGAGRISVRSASRRARLASLAGAPASRSRPVSAQPPAQCCLLNVMPLCPRPWCPK